MKMFLLKLMLIVFKTTSIMTTHFLYYLFILAVFYYFNSKL